MVEVPPFVETVLERVEHSGTAATATSTRAVDARAEPSEPEIVFVGRITPYKGVDVAIQALALPATVHGISATLTVAGPADGDYAARAPGAGRTRSAWPARCNGRDHCRPRRSRRCSHTRAR